MLNSIYEKERVSSSLPLDSVLTESPELLLQDPVDDQPGDHTADRSGDNPFKDSLEHFFYSVHLYHLLSFDDLIIS